MASSSVYLLSILLFLAILQNGASRQCYNCSSQDWLYGWECGYNFKPSSQSVTLIECPDTVPCLKVKPPVIGGGSDIIERGCYNKKLCNDMSFCYTCEDDLCNNSNSITTSFVVLFLVVGFRYLVNYF